MTRTPLRIAIIPGDGIGKEVMAVGSKVLTAYAKKRGLALELVELDLGADRFLRDGATFPLEDQRMIREECSAVLLGALGDPGSPTWATPATSSSGCASASISSRTSAR
jgi:3-isopropylmalate dehydrogenase